MTETAAPPPQPATAPSPPPKAEPQPQQQFNNAFSEIDKLFVVEPEPEPQPKREAAEQPASKEKPADTEQQKAPEKQQPEKALEDKPKAEGKGGHVASLRDAYETAKKRISDLETQLKAPREDPERKAISEKLDNASKRIAQLESDLRESAYERTDEYKQEFEQPIVNAFKNAYADVAQIEVENEDGTTRKLTNEDFNSILQMPLGQATREASKLGPAATAILLQHRQQILALHNRKNESLGHFKQKYLERQEQQKVIGEKQHTALIENWTKANDEAKSKYPQFFAPDDGDEEGNALLEKGFEIADKMFDGSRLTPQERVNLHAAVRNKAGAFDRMVYRNRKLVKKVEQLEKELEDFRKSEPSGESSKREQAQKPKTWEDELDALAHST